MKTPDAVAFGFLVIYSVVVTVLTFVCSWSFGKAMEAINDYKKELDKRRIPTYVYVQPEATEVACTKWLIEGQLAVDLDKDGKLIGVEII